MKVLIVHDRFQFKGGAERLILILAEALKADLMTEFWTSESFEVPKEFYLPQHPPYKGGELKALPLAKGEVWRE